MTNTAILDFLIELRKRLLNCVVVLGVIFLISVFFANDLYTLLAQPLLKNLPGGLIATQITSPFFVPFELTFFGSLFLAMPFFLHQLWSFIAPALYQHERRFIWALLVMSSFLFYLGIAFAYFVIFPVIFKFLVHAAPRGVMVTPDVSAYLDFTLKLFFVFGIIFEVPIITILLIKLKVMSRKQIIKMRPYAIVSAFILAMFLAPPDVFSQILLAIPLWLLFEIGIVISYFLE